ncbi:MAG: hypothetical protein AAB557_04635 [Patescibacteria group bacterium]
MNTILLDTNDPQIFSLLEQLIHHYRIDTLLQEEQTLFYLEFARVIRRRCEKFKENNPHHVSDGAILLHEIEEVANNSGIAIIPCFLGCNHVNYILSGAHKCFIF